MRGRSGEGDKAARDRVARSEDSVKGGQARRETKKGKLNKVQTPRDGNGERKAPDWGRKHASKETCVDETERDGEEGKKVSCE